MKPKISIQKMTMAAMMTAILCILAPLSLPIGPIPVSLTNFVLYLILYTLGWQLGTISYIIYLGIGLVGIPVFSGYSGGAGKILGPTGGYLLGFLFLCITTGIGLQKSRHHVIRSILSMLIGLLICYAFGTLWLAYQANLSFRAALLAGVVPFLIGDAIKIGLAAWLGPALQRRISHQ